MTNFLEKQKEAEADLRKAPELSAKRMTRWLDDAMVESGFRLSAKNTNIRFIGGVEEPVMRYHVVFSYPGDMSEDEVSEIVQKKFGVQPRFVLADGAAQQGFFARPSYNRAEIAEQKGKRMGLVAQKTEEIAIKLEQLGWKFVPEKSKVVARPSDSVVYWSYESKYIADRDAVVKAIRKAFGPTAVVVIPGIMGSHGFFVF